MRIRGAIFDLDGTVVENSYDWPSIKEELGTEGTPILEYLNTLAEPTRSAKWRVLERHEAEQTELSRPREGIHELLDYLVNRDIRTALVTNNSEKNAKVLLRKFGLRFDLVITREGGLWKPSGAPFLEVMRLLDLEPDESCVIGDTRFDVLAALDSGIKTIFLLSEDPSPFEGLPVEIFPSLDILRERIEELLGT